MSGKLKRRPLVRSLFVVSFSMVKSHLSFLVNFVNLNNVCSAFPFVPLVSVIYYSGFFVFAGYSPRSTRSFRPCLRDLIDSICVRVRSESYLRTILMRSILSHPHTDDDVFYLFLQKQKSAQSSIPQGYFPQHEAV
jgi:hypothetical protein